MSTSKQTNFLTPNRSTEKARLSDGQNLPKNTPSGLKDYTVQPRLSASPQSKHFIINQPQERPASSLSKSATKIAASMKISSDLTVLKPQNP